MGCKNCGGSSCNDPIFPYKVVQTNAEMRAIPCGDRINGMIVTVIGEGFKQYQLQGGDICNNNNWKSFGLTFEEVNNSMGHALLEVGNCDSLNNTALDSYYPEAKPGFRVSVEACNVTYMKISNHRWVAYSTFSNNDLTIERI